MLMLEELNTVKGLWLKGAKTFLTCVCICVYLQYGTGTEMNGSRGIGMLMLFLWHCAEAHSLMYTLFGCMLRFGTL